MLQTFCYLCIKKPLTLPHTPLRLLKHRTKNTYEPPKARTRRTNHKKNDQKHEPKERPEARTQRTNHEKNDPKARTTKRTTERTNPEERTTKSTTEKHEPKSTNPAPMFQARLTAPVLQARLSKPQSTASAPNRFLAPQNAILPLS